MTLMNLKLHRNTTSQTGTSLIEVLVAFSLISIMLLLLMPFQLRLLRHTQYNEHINLACTMQCSLAEHLKACQSNARCQQHTIQQWESNIKHQFPGVITKITQHQGHYHSTLVFHHDAKPFIFEFTL